MIFKEYNGLDLVATAEQCWRDGRSCQLSRLH